MSDFRMLHTPQGESLLAQVHAGVVMQLTRVVLGNGIWTAEEQASHSLTGLKAQCMSLAITDVTQSGDEAEVTAMLDNSALAAGFSCTEMGIYAQPLGGEEVLYMVGYLEPAKSSFVHSKNGTPMLIPVTVTIVVAGSSEVTIAFKNDFYYVTKTELTRHDTDPDAHGVLLDSVRAHAPLVVIVSSADIMEGGDVQLLIQDWATYEWPSEIKLLISNASGTDVTDTWTVTPNLTTGRIDLTAPQVDADQTYGIAVQVWEHGLVRSNWTRALTVNVGDIPINQPTITAPAAGATGLGETPTITTSGFSADGVQTHADTQMQIATDTGFSDIVRDTASLGAVLSYDVPPGILTTGQVYYVRARHKGSDGNWSPWSPVSSFFTAASFIYVDRPVNTSPEIGAGEIGETPTLGASAFSTNGVGNFAHARFQVDVVGGDFSAPVHDSGVLGAVTEYTIPADVLAVSTQYKWRTQYTDDSGVPVVSDWSSPTTFTTAANFLTPWAEWDEANEASLSHLDTFVVMFENPNAGGNEIGAGGGLDESVRTLIQTNNVDGALGTPPSRQVDGGKQFAVKAGVLNLVTANANRTWTIVIRHDVSFPTNNNSNLGWMNNAGYTRRLFSQAGMAGGHYAPTVMGSGGSASPTSIPTGSGYWCWWCDGTNVYCGWCATKPTKLSDFQAGTFVNATAAGKAFPADFDGLAFTDPFPLPYGSGRSVSEKLRFFVVSRECLIDNNA